MSNIWASILPILGGIAGTLVAPGIGTAIGSGLGEYAATGNLGQGVSAGLMGYGLGGLAGGLMGAGAGSAATQAAIDSGSTAAAAGAGSGSLGAMNFGTSGIAGSIGGDSLGAMNFGSGLGSTVGPAGSQISSAAANGVSGLGGGNGFLSGIGSKISNMMTGASQPSAWTNTIMQHPLGILGPTALGLGGLLAANNQPQPQAIATPPMPNLVQGPLQRPAGTAPNPYYAMTGPEFNYFPNQQLAHGGAVQHYAPGGSVYPGQYDVGALQAMSSPAQNLGAQQAQSLGISPDEAYDALRGGYKSQALGTMLRNALYGNAQSGAGVPMHMANGGGVGDASVAQNLIAEAKAALSGEGRNPEDSLRRFVMVFGPDALQQLRAQMAGPGGAVQGAGGGTDDMVPGTIDGDEPVQLANDEHVVPADVVSGIGNGSSTQGHRMLKEMSQRVRKARTGNPNMAKTIDASNYMPA